MANLYWRGGTASWDGSATGKWSTDPTTFVQAPDIPRASNGDAVFFDSSSTGTVTIAAGNAGAGSVDCTGFVGTLSFSAAISIAGSLTFVTGMTVSGTARITFTGTGTFTTANKNIGSFTLNAPGGTLDLNGNCTCVSGGSQRIIITAGTFNTNNYDLSHTQSVSSSYMDITGSSPRTINLGSSTLTFAVGNGTCWDASTTTNLTFNSGTSTIVFTGTPAGGGQTFNGGGLTYHNVRFSTGAASTVPRNITGANTFNNLTIENNSTGSGSIITTTLAANQTFKAGAAVTFSSTSAVHRNFLRSTVIGTARNLTFDAGTPGTFNGTDCDFRDITIVNSPSSTTTRSGDCGSNVGITFPAAKTVYWNLAAGGSWSSTGWAASSGASPAITNFPLAQDTAVIEATGLTSGNTITINDAFNIGSVDLSARTSPSNLMTLANGTVTPSYYGNFTLGSGVTTTGTGTCTFVGRTTQTIKTAGRTITFPVTVDGAGTVFLLDGSFTGSSTFTLTQGTVDCNNSTLSCTTFSSNTSNTRTIAFGLTGNIGITVPGATTVWNTSTQTGLTVTGTPVVNIANALSAAIAVTPGSPTEANSISFNFTSGSYALTLSSGNVRSLSFASGVGTTSLNNAARTIYGDFIISSSSTMSLTAGANAQTFAGTSGTKTITSGNKTFDFPVVFNGAGSTWQLATNDLTLGATRTLTHTNGTIDLNGRTLTIGTTGTYTTATGTKNLTFNGGTLAINGSGTSFNNAQPTNFTTTAGTGTGKISMLSASPKTFAGGGSTFNCTLSNDSSTALTIQGSNSFSTLANGVVPTTFTFTSGTTTTINNTWNINGTSGVGNLVVINSSTAGSQHILSKSSLSGNVTASYLNITDSNATGGASWDAGATSTNGGNNLGWSFGGAVFSDSASDSLSFSDAVTSALSYVSSATDSLTFSDAVSNVVTFVATSSDSFTITDTAVGGLSVSNTATDTITFTDSTSSTLPISETVSDSFTLTDSSSVQATLVGSAADSLVLADLISSTGTFTVTLTDSLSFADTDSASISMSFSLSDSFVLSDATSLQLNLIGDCSDALVFADALSSTASLGVSLQDDIAFLDLAQNIASLLASASDTITFSDVPNLYSLGWTPISSGVANPWSQISSGASNPWSPISSGAANPWTPIT